MIKKPYIKLPIRIPNFVWALPFKNSNISTILMAMMGLALLLP